MTYVPTTQQIGDTLNNGLSKQSFEDLIDKLGMTDISIHTSLRERGGVGGGSVERLRFLVSLNLCYLIKDHIRFVC